MMVLSLSSAVFSALMLGKDPWRAAKDALNPYSPHWGDLVLGKYYLPLGGPYRALFKAILPRKTNWSGDIPVPFAGLYNFLKNKAGPAPRQAFDQIRNQDYWGTTIRKGGPIESLARGLAYMAEETAPLTVGAGIEAVRRGIPPGEGAEETVFQFLGTNRGVESPRRERAILADEMAKDSGYETLTGKRVNKTLDLNRAQMRSLIDGSDEYKKLTEEIHTETHRNSSDYTRARLETQTETRKVFEQKMVDIAISLVAKHPNASKRWYDKQRGIIRAEHRGATGALWSLRGLTDASSIEALEKWVKKNQRPEDAAMDVYYQELDKRRALLGIMTSADWDKLTADLKSWAVSKYGSAIAQYIEDHKDDWILDLPKISRDLEIRRKEDMESGDWFDNYGGTSTDMDVLKSLMFGKGQNPRPGQGPRVRERELVRP